MSEATMGEVGMEPLLSVHDMRVKLRDRFGVMREVVRGVSLEVRDGEALGIVGESGSGKTVFVEALTRLVQGARCSGRVHWRGDAGNLLQESGHRLGKLRGGHVSYLFGGIRDSLHSHVSVREQMKEVLNHHRAEVNDEREEIVYWLNRVGIAEPEATMRAFSWRLDVMTRTRVNIAMAMCALPQLLIADEPTAGLGPADGEEVLRLIRELRERAGVAMLLATRDFRVVRKLAQRLVVMEAGKIVEEGELDEMMSGPKHALTREMLAALRAEEAR